MSLEKYASCRFTAITTLKTTIVTVLTRVHVDSPPEPFHDMATDPVAHIHVNTGVDPLPETLFKALPRSIWRGEKRGGDERERGAEVLRRKMSWERIGKEEEEKERR